MGIIVMVSYKLPDKIIISCIGHLTVTQIIMFIESVVTDLLHLQMSCRILPLLEPAQVPHGVKVVCVDVNCIAVSNA